MWLVNFSILYIQLALSLTGIFPAPGSSPEFFFLPGSSSYALLPSSWLFSFLLNQSQRYMLTQCTNILKHGTLYFWGTASSMASLHAMCAWANRGKVWFGGMGIDDASQWQAGEMTAHFFSSPSFSSTLKRLSCQYFSFHQSWSTSSV